MTIWKYKLSTSPVSKLMMPKGAKVIDVRIDGKNNEPHIWAIVDESAPIEKRVFEIFCTGQTITGINPLYIGTFHAHNSEYVLHLFEHHI